MKKFISLLILSALILSSCGSGTSDETTQPENNDQTTIQANGDRLDELGERDFGKRKFIILDANDFASTSLNLPHDELTGDTLNDAVHDRDLRISERYNCEIEYIVGENAPKGCAAFSRSYLAGDYYCDLIATTVSNTDTLRLLASEGMLANLNDIDYLSFDKPWWSRLLNENLTLGGRSYFAAGDILPQIYTSPVVMVANTKLLEQYTPDADIIGLVDSGKWTIDELLAYTKFNNDVNGDNSLNTLDDFFGYIGDSTGKDLSTNAFIIGSGVSFTKTDGNSLRLDLMNDRVTTIIDKVVKLVPHETMSDRQDYINHTFKEDRAIFAQTYIGSIRSYLRDMESDYLILPIPKYDESQDGYRNLVNGWTAGFMGIPSNTDTDAVGFFAEALCYDSYKNVRGAVYDILLKAKLARDEDSTRMIDVIYDSLYLDFGLIYNFGGTNSVLSDVVYGNAQLASGLAEKQSAADQAIADFVASWLAD